MLRISSPFALSLVCFLFTSLSLTPVAVAQVNPSTTSFQTGASATTGPGSCTDPGNGGPGIPEATAFCTDSNGKMAAASAQANAATTSLGGSVFIHAEATATANGVPPLEQPNGSGSANALASWVIGSDTFYSLSLGSEGGANVDFSGAMSGGTLPASGILPADAYSLTVSGNAFAVARDINGPETITAIPVTGEGSVRFALVGSMTLVMGVVLADGVGVAGLFVEALDADALVISSTSTGDDGSYLLPELVGVVTVRASDPAGGFVAQQSESLSPPATQNFDLAPAPAAPALSVPAIALLCGAMLGLAAWAGHTRRSDRPIA